MHFSSKILIACALLFSASIGFFASAVIFNHAPSKFFCKGNPPFPAQMMRGEKTPERQMPASKNFKHFEEMNAFLGLSEVQKKNIEEQKKKTVSTRITLKKERLLVERRLQEILSTDKLDEMELKSLKDSLMTLNEKGLDAMIADVRFFVDQLTPEQNAKIRKFHKENGFPSTHFSDFKKGHRQKFDDSFQHRKSGFKERPRKQEGKKDSFKKRSKQNRPDFEKNSFL